MKDKTKLRLILAICNSGLQDIDYKNTLEEIQEIINIKNEPQTN